MKGDTVMNDKNMSTRNDTMHDNSMMDSQNVSSGAIMNHMTANKIMIKNDYMMSMSHIDSPLKQLERGVLSHDIKCGVGYTVVFKAHNNSPACVRPSSVQLLVKRGWVLGGDAMIVMNNNSMPDKMQDSMQGKTMSNDTNHSMPNMNHTITSVTDNIHSHMMDESQFKKAPSLVGITGYINTTPDELEQEMKGKVVLYEFWTFNCINCIHTLPYMTALDAKYADKGLLIIGIHSPETVVEKDPNNVQNAVEKFGIKYPVVLDNNYNTWSAFGNIYWPRQYLVDPNGYIRYDHIGEGNYDELEKEIQNLLAEKNQNT
jgi:thiol-disulfide isomerase/thioredoxin